MRIYVENRKHDFKNFLLIDFIPEITIKCGNSFLENN